MPIGRWEGLGSLESLECLGEILEGLESLGKYEEKI